MALGAVIVLAGALQAWSVPYYALTPGNATAVAPLVKIAGLRTDSSPDKILLTDVYLQSLSAWQWLIMHFQSHVEFVSAAQLVEPGIPTDELGAQGFLEMSDSKQAAEVAALEALGWRLRPVHDGAVVTGVVAPSPARTAGLRVADRIVGVNGAPVRSACALISAVHALAPGTTVQLRVAHARISPRGVISWNSPSSVAVRTAPAPSGLGPSGCVGVHGTDRSWLGLSPEDGVHYALPGAIGINTSNIGGPSAGLAMTLTLIDQLSSGSLTGHHVIAATGTIAPNGAVGDVGGVAEKTVAVQRSGATVFFVPRVEVATATRVAQPGLRIIGVTTLHQALHDLRLLGGAAPIALTKPH